MKLTESMEAIMKKIGVDGIKAGDEVTSDFGHALRFYEEADNSTLNFYEIIRRFEIDSIVGDMKKAGIKEFTLSESSTALMEIINEFCKNGCSIIRPVEVYEEYSIDRGEEAEKIPALLFKIN